MKKTFTIITVLALFCTTYINVFADTPITTTNNDLNYIINGTSTQYNPELATQLMRYSISAYNKGLDGIYNTDSVPKQSVATHELIKQTTIYQAYSNADFKNITLCNYYDDENDPRYGKDNCAFTLGYKEIPSGNNMVLVTMRGSVGSLQGLSSDWVSNFNMKLEGNYHTGFFTAAEGVYKSISDYIVDNKLSNVKYVITGHSRGAAIANLVATKLIDNGTSINNVFCYTFACPDVSVDTKSTKNYPCIFNICNSKDFVTLVPRIASYAYDTRIKANYSNGITLLATMLGATQNISTSTRWCKNGTTLWFTKESNHTVPISVMGFTLPSYIDIYSHAPNVYLDQMLTLNDFSKYEQEGDICVIMNGYPLTFDQAPVIINDRTLVPLRKIFESLGAAVSWDDNTQTAIAVKDATTIKITVNNNILHKNDTKIELDVPAQLINDRTLVPVRAISEAFNCTVDWDDTTQSVIINQ